MYRIDNHISKTTANKGKDSRFSLIARLGEDIFYAKDLANLWQIKDANTLYTTLKRYAQKGWLVRIYKGLYSVKPLERLNPLELGVKALHRYAYVSAETVLAQAGFIQQAIKEITLISSISKRFSIHGNDYYSRRLKDEYLFNDAGVKNANGLRIATAERAVADLLYFNPRAFFDAREMIDWKKVKEIQKYVFTQSKRSNS